MNKNEYVKGLSIAGGAFIMWGLLPIYWKWVAVVTPYELFSQRVIWSLLFVVIIMILKGSIKDFYETMRNPKNILKTIAPSFFISFNWLTFIWGVNNGYVLETSLGYYINPLMFTFFGNVLFGEKLSRSQKLGIGFATVGVIYKTLSYGKVPYISLALAFSFTVYGLLKKKSSFTSLTGLGIETLIISFPALIYLFYVEGSHQGIIGNLPPVLWLKLSVSGILTAAPLLLYSEGTKRLPLSVLGFMQYIAPTISLFLGVFVYREAFDFNSAIAFALIWIGLIIFTREQVLLIRGRHNTVNELSD